MERQHRPFKDHGWKILASALTFVAWLVCGIAIVGENSGNEVQAMLWYVGVSAGVAAAAVAIGYAD